MSHRIYVIGDVHGELEMLRHAMAKISADGGSDASVVLLGDYIDRGAASRQVIEYLIDGLNAGKNWICLRGNHDRMFAMFMEDYPRADPQIRHGFHWLHARIGGVQTLASYGVEVSENDVVATIHQAARAAVPASHIEFLDSLRWSYQRENLLFVHAGIRPGISIDQQSNDDLIWIRKDFHDYVLPHPLLIVHGHTPVTDARHYGNRVNLDTGAGYGQPLSTAVFEGTHCWLLTDDGRKPLLPNPVD